MLKRKIASAIASGALLLGTFAGPAFAATSLEVSGNGANSVNDVTVNKDTTKTVSQNNDALVTNYVTSGANSGGNVANYNTNGNVTVATGNASSTTDVTTNANLNKATIGNTEGVQNVTANISGNGFASSNNAALNHATDTNLFQNNSADIYNDVYNKANTGYNNADGNTGGNVTVGTGNATARTTVTNNANANVAQIGSDTASAGTLTANVTGNGALSDSQIYLDTTRTTTVSQNNYAAIANAIVSKANSGENSALNNTNGDVVLATGHALNTTTVDNQVNFNTAVVDDAIATTTAGVSGNGFESLNTILANLNNDLLVWQGGEQDGNNADLYNDIYTKAKSGWNDTSGNTGSVLGDPTLLVTGSAVDTTNVSNRANANLFGSSLSLPQLPVQFSFDLGGVFGVFGLSR